MDYCIKNNKNVYIKLDDTGRPVTCVKSVSGRFEYSKAKNILNHLPKTLKNMHFSLQPIPDIKKPKEEIKEKTIKNRDDYILSENIIQWVDKFGACADILEEARKRQEELVNDLRIKDKELLDILHIVEIERSKDLYNGCLLYKRIRENRKARREIKDELIIIGNVLKEINPRYFQRDKVQSAIDGLFNREYSFRIIDDDNNDGVEKL